MKLIFLSLCLLLSFTDIKSCANKTTTRYPVSPSAITEASSAPIKMPDRIKMGAEDLQQYLPLLKSKRVALLVNQTSVFRNRTCLVDSLFKLGVHIQKIFAPEHGFRGIEDAGADINNQIDKKTGVPIVSLYGNKVKPSALDLSNVDIVVFDIQDVGVRFYTFISTMYYMMEACAENKKELIILDRPNPNGYYVDGPILDMSYKSFVGIVPIPIVHGCTVAELAKMMNGEGWLKDSLHCKLTIVRCKNYDHARFYSLPIKPSPNLGNDRAIQLYPSICLFEGTEVSVGRGTNFPFQVIGSPYASMLGKAFEFTPQSKAGASNPPFKDKKCYGVDLRLSVDEEPDRIGKIQLSYLIDMYKAFGANKALFFHTDNFFEKLAGTSELREQIKAGLSEEEIRMTWQDGLNEYKQMRKKYLLYNDFE